MGQVQAQGTQPVLNAATGNNTLLWEISGNGLKAPSYLFGTFHMLCKDDINITPALKQAVARSSEVYLELDMDDPATFLSGIMLMNMKDGKKLKDLYSAEAYTRVSSFFKDSLRTPIGAFQTMKPFFLQALLFPKMMSCASMGSVEDEIMSLAKENKIQVRGLETMAFQASLFDSIPYEKQAGELLESIDSLTKSRLYFSRMVKAYKEQRLDDIEKIMNSPELGMGEDSDILLDKRNKNWVAQLHTIMPKAPVFVAVGTGHLVGSNGLIALLRAAGYVVKGVENR